MQYLVGNLITSLVMYCMIDFIQKYFDFTDAQKFHDPYHQKEIASEIHRGTRTLILVLDSDTMCYINVFIFLILFNELYFVNILILSRLHLSY